MAARRIREYDRTGGVMDLEIAGKRALVTGSTAGIGLAAATSLAAEGAIVTVNGRTRARVDAAVAAVRGSVTEASCSGVVADISTAAGCDAVVRQLGDMDILVNSLGIFEPMPFEQI